MNTVYHYQEIICLQTESPLASELLLRTHNQYSLSDMLLQPELFEEYIDELVKAKLKASAALWETTKTSAIFLNFTSAQLTHPHFREVSKQLSRSTGNGRLFCIEVTEDVKSDQWALMESNLMYAKSQNLLVAIDDFGKGYSNFSRLLSLSPDIVKLDNQYIDRATKSRTDREAFFRLVEFLQDLNSKVVVEGIENDTAKKIAKQSNAELGQGYALHMPSPIQFVDTTALSLSTP
ncbi:hypothetical protein C9975_04605 [Thalassospira xiamenensis]|nr:hypothetical protein C9975_04605 [Thalassospira xiamenensis]